MGEEARAGFNAHDRSGDTEECQSIPITRASAWNQNGSLSRERNADVP